MFTITHMGHGGLQKKTTLLINWLLEHTRHEIYLLTSEINRDYHNLRSSPNFQAIIIDEMRRKPSLISDAKTVFAIHKHMSRIRPDVVYFSGPKASFLTSIASTFTATKTRIYNISGTIQCISRNRLVNLAYFAYEWITIALSHKVIFVSWENHARYERTFGILRRRKTDVIRSGFNIDSFKVRSMSSRSALRKSLGLLDGQVVVCSASSLIKGKNVVDVLKVARLLSEQGADFVFLILGEGPEKAKLMADAKALGIADQVMFRGYVENVHDYFAASDAFLFTSKYPEGLPQVIVQAAVSGLHVFTYDVPGIADLASCPGLHVASDPLPQALADDMLDHFKGDRQSAIWPFPYDIDLHQPEKFAQETMLLLEDKR